MRKLGIQLTELCAPACALCAAKPRRRSLPVDTFERALLEARAVGIHRVLLAGGEPLVHEDLNAIVDIALAIRIEVEVLATGYRLDQREPALRRLKDNIKMMWADFHGGTPETHDRVTGRPGSFRDARAVLATAVELGVARGARLVPTPEAIAEETGWRASLAKFDPVFVVDRSTPHLPRAAWDLARPKSERCADASDEIAAVVAASGLLWPCFASLGASALPESSLPQLDGRFRELLPKLAALEQGQRCGPCKDACARRVNELLKPA